MIRNLSAVGSFRHVNVQELAEELMLTLWSRAKNKMKVFDEMFFFQVNNILRKRVSFINIEPFNILMIFSLLIFAFKGSERVEAVEIFIAG